MIIAPGRYVVTGVLSMAGQNTSDSSAVDVIRGATGNPADVVLDGDGQHNIMNLARGVLVHGITFSNGAAPDMGCFERTYPLGTLLLFK